MTNEYKEALERARQAINNDAYTKEEALTYAFPELGDSETEAALKTISIALQTSKAVSDQAYKDATAWINERLRTLRPQCRWKPSEEQMKELKMAVDEHFDVDGGPLWDLYNDLEKLM